MFDLSKLILFDNLKNTIMKIHFFNGLILLFYSTSIAQTPQKMSYQSIIRNSNNTLVSSTTVGIRISLLQGSSNGLSVYAETHTVSTNQNGVANFEIGNGTVLFGSFSSIDWGNGIYFVKTETDINGGTNYTITGTSPFTSVPYALFAVNTPQNPVSGFTHYIGEEFDGGIIYYLYKGSDGIEHGLIVSKTHSGNLFLENSGFPTMGAFSKFDGAANTDLMTNSDAKNYVTSLGSGWYIPAIDQLRLLWLNRIHVNSVLEETGCTPIPLFDYYWSSSELSVGSWLLVFQTGQYIPTGFQNQRKVRAVRSF